MTEGCLQCTQQLGLADSPSAGGDGRPSGERARAGCTPGPAACRSGGPVPTPRAHRHPGSRAPACHSGGAPAGPGDSQGNGAPACPSGVLRQTPENCSLQPTVLPPGPSSGNPWGHLGMSALGLTEGVCTRMCVCMHVYVHVSVCARVFICVQASVCVYMCTRVCVFLHVCACACVFCVHMFVYVCASVFTCVCMCFVCRCLVRVSVCTCVCVCVQVPICVRVCVHACVHACMSVCVRCWEGSLEMRRCPAPQPRHGLPLGWCLVSTPQVLLLPVPSQAGLVAPVDLITLSQ